MASTDTHTLSPVTDPGKTITATQLSWAKDLLAALGFPQTDNNLVSIVAWEQAEGGWFNNTASYNPLNTTQDAPGASPINSVGVKAYPDYQTGLAATVKTLRNGYYGSILDALSSSAEPSYTGSLGALSTWGTGSFTGTIGYAEGIVGGTTSGPSATLTSATGAGAGGLIGGALGGPLGAAVGGSIGDAITGGSVPNPIKTLATDWVKPLVSGLLYLLFVGGGLALIILGLSRMFAGSITRAAPLIETAAAAA